MESTVEANDIVPQSTREESIKDVSQQPTTDNEVEVHEDDNDDNADSQPQPLQPPPYTTLRSVLDTLDQEEKGELVKLLLRCHFQEEKFDWMLTRKAGWIFDTNLGAYLSPPPLCAEEFPNGLPPLILTAQELHEYLDRFAITKLKSFLHRPSNPLSGMSESEIQRGRALRLRLVLLKFEQVRRRNSSTKPSAKASSSSNKSQQPHNGDNSSSSNNNNNQRKTTRQSTSHKDAPSTTEVEAVAANVLPQPQRPRRTSTTTTTSSHGPTKTASATVFEAGADMYFKKAKAKPGKKQNGKVKASTNTATIDSSNDRSTLAFHLTSPSECAKLVTEMSLSSPETEAELQAIEDSYANSFLEWKFILTTHHSLLLHGFGSKQKLLQRFAEEELDKEGDVLTIDGFDNEVTIERILDVIVLAFLDGKEPATTLAGGKRKIAPGRKSTSARASIHTIIPNNFLDTHPTVRRATSISKALATKVAETLRPAILVLHSIDGMTLRNHPAQEALAALVLNCNLPNTSTAMRGLWFVASADHVDVATLLWDTVCSASFAWIWKEVHTYQPHLNEIAMMDHEAGRNAAKKKSRSRTSVSTDAVAESFAFTVLDSVAPRHVEVVQILAGLQLQLQQSQPWVNIATLREQCVSKCAVRSDEQLRGYLDELEDHCIVQIQARQSKVRIPYSKDKLLEILEYKKETK